MKLPLLAGIWGICICFSCRNRTICKYEINDTLYIKTSTVTTNGYTFTYLCNKKDGTVKEIYGKDFYTGRIEDIQIERVMADTVIFTTYYQNFNGNLCQHDTLILSACRLLSKPRVEECVVRE
jgi:hypothetical protein